MELLGSLVTPAGVGLSVTVVFLAWAGPLVYPHIHTFVRTHLRYVPGPDADSFLLGNLPRIFKAQAAEIHEEWRKTYGATFVYRGFFRSYRLCTFDPRALQHVLNTTSVYQKPADARKFLIKLLGDGLLTAEGDTHRRQRKVMNPAFGNAQLRELVDVFHTSALELRDVWKAKTAERGTAHVDALSWLSKATLDIIGRGGFGYEFSSVAEKSNELSQAFSKVFATTQTFNWWIVARNFIPVLKIIPSQREVDMQVSKATMDRIARELVQEKKQALAAGEKGAGRDVLSLLIQANMDKDLPDNMRLSDEEVIGQIMVMLVAGHETTATTTTWCFYRMSLHPDIQDKLRSELLAVETETPSMEQLNALPYLDAVVRETLRVHSTVSSTVRTAVQDDSLPVSTPFVDRNGVTRSEIKISKGDIVFLPLLAVNRDPEIWGDDHREFKPERWLCDGLPGKSALIPGVLAGSATFLGGARACIGYRFALLEMKALIFQLLRAFKVELDIDPNDIEPRSSLVTRPFIKSDRTNRLPVVITAL